MQAICICNRPADVGETLPFWENLVPWIDEVLLICPEHLRDKMPSGKRLNVRSLDEATILGPQTTLFRETSDHQLKNLLLRAGIAKSDSVDDVFLMFDDDHRPLAEINIEDFIEDGRHHNYYFYELDHWRAHHSDFDKGQHNTHRALRSNNLPTRAYAAHMPQIIDKLIFGEAISAFYSDISEGTALDEWSIYFNYALNAYPERFHQPRAFATLCWPALPTDWELDVRPTRFLFENFHRSLYEPGRIFSDLSTGFIEAEVEKNAAIKISRRMRIQDAFDSGSARLHRRLCWLLYRAITRTDAATNRFSHARRFFANATPKSIRQSISNVVKNGADPAFWKSYG